ncbi:hypothetical protein [Streptomyces sp. NPDC093591]|uniref:MmyB family transcriptional regulator n=1 Tax=Streptomyces sp. NPDC093591 TaxID=3366044 RepID=UPI0037F4A62D
MLGNWQQQGRGCAAPLRALAETDPDAPDLIPLAGELFLKSPDFTRIWKRHTVKNRARGPRAFHHPEVGDLTLGHQAMDLAGTPANGGFCIACSVTRVTPTPSTLPAPKEPTYANGIVSDHVDARRRSASLCQVGPSCQNAWATAGGHRRRICRPAVAARGPQREGQCWPVTLSGREYEQLP